MFNTMSNKISVGFSAETGKSALPKIHNVNNEQNKRKMVKSSNFQTNHKATSAVVMTL